MIVREIYRKKEDIIETIMRKVDWGMSGMLPNKFVLIIEFDADATPSQQFLLRATFKQPISISCYYHPAPKDQNRFGLSNRFGFEFLSSIEYINEDKKNIRNTKAFQMRGKHISVPQDLYEDINCIIKRLVDISELSNGVII